MGGNAASLSISCSIGEVPCRVVYFFEVYSQAFGFLSICVVGFRALEYRYSVFYGAGNLEGLSNSLERLLDVCKLVLPYLLLSFCDVLADKI